MHLTSPMEYQMNPSRSQEKNELYSTFTSSATSLALSSSLHPPSPSQGHIHLQQQPLHGHHHVQHHQLLHSRYDAEFYVYEVEFKRGKEYFEKSIACREDFDLGDFVRVEGDRGFEVGVVCHRSIQSSSSLPFFSQNGQPNLRKIVGRANDHEKKYVQMKVRDESRALHICNELAAKRRLPILMLDAEFQTDRNKLTFLYISDVRVDFRELVRDLFSLFKTRIWMQKLDIHGKPIHSSMPSGDPNGPPALPQLQHLFTRYGRDDLANLSYSSMSSLYEANYTSDNFTTNDFLKEDLLAGVHYSCSDLAPEAEPYVPLSYSSTPPLAELGSRSPPTPPKLHLSNVELRRNLIPKHSGPKISPSSATSIHFFSDNESGMEERNYYPLPYNANAGKKTTSPGLFPLGYSPSTVMASNMLPPYHPNTNHYHSQSKHHPNRANHAPHSTLLGMVPNTGISSSTHQHHEYGTGFHTTWTSSHDPILTARSRSTDSIDAYRPSDDYDTTTNGTFLFE